jgi:ubiquinone/menaquinone biosynthesis C-methylase UbiE
MTAITQTRATGTHATQATGAQATSKDDVPCPCIKAHQKAVWDDGDYASFATYMEAGAVDVLNSWNIPAGTSLLDVACGSGQTALPAARNGVKVTGIDIAESQIQAAQYRAAEEGLDARFEVGDAEELPYADASYDVAVSMFGAMFAPDPVAVVSEFARVTKPGGQLIMANWTSTCMPARMFKCVSSFMPPPPGLIPPVLWGDEETVKHRLGEKFTDIKLTRKIYPQWDYPFSASKLVDLFRAQFGPVKRAFEHVEPRHRQELHDSLEEIFQAESETRDGVLSITSGQFLEVIATRR